MNGSVLIAERKPRSSNLETNQHAKSAGGSDVVGTASQSNS